MDATFGREAAGVPQGSGQAESAHDLEEHGLRAHDLESQERLWASLAKSSPEEAAMRRILGVDMCFKIRSPPLHPTHTHSMQKQLVWGRLHTPPGTFEVQWQW